jgi:hypothetical protein
MTANMSKGNGPKKDQQPLWRRKANYMLRELVRAGHGLPYDTAVIWGLNYALADILHTFAKENDLPVPKLIFWFDRFWEEFSKDLGERILTIADSMKLADILLSGFPPDKMDVGRRFVRSESICSMIHLASILFLSENRPGALLAYFSSMKWPLAYYEALDVAPLDSFTIWYVKRVHFGGSEN